MRCISWQGTKDNRTRYASKIVRPVAVVSKGNLRTADTHRRVGRAQAATDAALEIASRRLEDAASRFLVARGEITPAYADDLWMGTYAVTPPVTVLPPGDDAPEPALPVGIKQALESRFAADDVVCIIEAMKVMNEIKSEARGEVVEILVENGEPVEFGQPLFHYKA